MISRSPEVSGHVKAWPPASSSTKADAGSLATSGPSRPDKEPSLSKIMAVVVDGSGISEEEIVGRRRLRPIVTARHLYFYLAYTMTKSTIRVISGNKHHSLVIHSTNKIKRRMAEESHFAVLVFTLEKKLENHHAS